MIRRAIVWMGLSIAAACASTAAVADTDVGIYLGVPAPVYGPPTVYAPPPPVYYGYGGYPGYGAYGGYGGGYGGGYRGDYWRGPQGRAQYWRGPHGNHEHWGRRQWRERGPQHGWDGRHQHQGRW